MTEFLFRRDAYRFACPARIIESVENGVILDQTIAYPTGGGQPGDSGTVLRADGEKLAFAEARYADATKSSILLRFDAPATFRPGEAIEVEIDAARRLAHMRMHTALHLLSVVLPYPVTGGAIGASESRLDFDIAEGGLDKAEISARLNDLIARDAAVSDRYITEEELDANPQLVKTMTVKPPRGAGTVRLVEIEGLDLQPCGGTHVRRTGEIGRVEVTNIEKKGRLNRRVRIAFSA